MTYSEITLLLKKGKYRTLLLDRDGVINTYRPNDYVKCWEEFEFIPDFLEHISQWSKITDHIFIVTNQRGVSKGLFSEQTLCDIHKKMLQAIENKGGKIDKIYYCTAIKDDDPNRKPQTGMFQQILKDYSDVCKESCLMIGDQPSDKQFASNCGIEGVLIKVPTER